MIKVGTVCIYIYIHITITGNIYIYCIYICMNMISPSSYTNFNHGQVEYDELNERASQRQAKVGSTEDFPRSSCDFVDEY